MKQIMWLFIALGVLAWPIVGRTNSSTTYTNALTEVGMVASHTKAVICLPDYHPPIATGSAWADYDNDGDVDAFVTDMGAADHLYRNEGVSDVTRLPDYIDMASFYGMEGAGDASLGAVFVDYDNDGDQDLFVTKWGGNSLYQNQLIETGLVSFVEVADAAGVRDDGRAITAAWGDYDQDGYLDLYLPKHRYCRDDERHDDHLYHNNGDGTFTKVTYLLCDGALQCPATKGLGFTAGWLDYDNDADLDLYIINDDIAGNYYPNVLWRNDGFDEVGEWVFTDVSAPAGVDYSLSGMGLAIGDYNNNGWLDMAFSDIGPVVLVENNGDGTFADVSVASNVHALTNGMVGWGTLFMDYDNDQFLDLYTVNGFINNSMSAPNIFLVNNRDETFFDFSLGSGLDDVGRGRAANLNDFDKNGFVDVFVGNYGQAPVLYRHSGEGAFPNALVVTVEGTTSNRDGIGTRLWLETENGVTQMREINSGATYGGGDQRIAHFGMADATMGNLTIRWPDGTIQPVGTISAGQYHFVEPIPTAIELTTVSTQTTSVSWSLWVFVTLVLLTGGVVSLRRKWAN